jgi:prolipoprotein diacylglyceryl transferase
MGARLGHCFFYEISYFLNHPFEILLPIKKIGSIYKFIGFQGLSSHGGAIGVLISIILYSIKYKTNLLWILDRIAIAVPITASFIRIGNLINSEIYGKPTNGNWGIIFWKVDSIPRHPTQLYEALSYFFIFIFLINNTAYLKRKNGLIFGMLLALLFSIRFAIEFFKENQEDFEDKLFLNMGQFLSIPFVLIGLFLIFRKR